MVLVKTFSVNNSKHKIFKMALQTCGQKPSQVATLSNCTASFKALFKRRDNPGYSNLKISGSDARQFGTHTLEDAICGEGGGKRKTTYSEFNVFEVFFKVKYGLHCFVNLESPGIIMQGI